VSWLATPPTLVVRRIPERMRTVPADALKLMLQPKSAESLNHLADHFGCFLNLLSSSRLRFQAAVIKLLSNRHAF
jgi:hypothetical protein